MEVQRIPKRTVSVIEPQKSILVDKEKYHQKRVAAYCRVSTDSEEQLTSYQNQMRVYTEMIAANKEWEFAGLYADEGISGTRADKRPEFQRMIASAKSKEHPYDVILVWKFSRFARNQEESIVYKSMLKKNGIDVISVSEPMPDDIYGGLDSFVEDMEFSPDSTDDTAKAAMNDDTQNQAPAEIKQKASEDVDDLSGIADEYSSFTQDDLYTLEGGQDTLDVKMCIKK